MIKYILFDLDGTLTDSGEGITNSAAYALKKMGRKVPARERLYPFIGPPLTETFTREFGMTPEECREAIRFYREYFAERGIFENHVYDGVPEMLSGLKERGKRLLVATSKPSPYAEQVVEHFHLETYFDFIASATTDDSRGSKGLVIQHALQSMGIEDPKTAIMVGDRRHDVEGARENGLECIGVLYGFGGREELMEAGAVELVKTPEELVQLFL